MLFWLGLLMTGLVLAGFYTAQSERKDRAEKLNKIQRELARRETAEKSQQMTETQD